MRLVALGSTLFVGLGLWSALAAPADEDPSGGSEAVPSTEVRRSTYTDWQLLEERLARVALEQRVRDLEHQLARAETAILRQEEAFQSWLQVLSSLSPELVPTAEAAAVDVGLLDPDEVSEPPAEAGPAPDPADHPDLKRADELAALLRGLLRSEEISGLDLLEPGRFAEGKLGPVVFRTLDDRGRLTGSITAVKIAAIPQSPAPLPPSCPSLPAQ